MKFSVNDNEAGFRSRRSPSASSSKDATLINDGQEKQTKSVLFHASTHETTMPTKSFRRAVSMPTDNDQNSLAMFQATHGELNGNRSRLVSECSNASVRSLRTRTMSESKGNPSPPPASRSKPAESVPSKKYSGAARRPSKDLRNRSESVSSDSTESSRQSAVYSVQSSAWDAFDEHVKNINDSTEYYTKQQKVSFRSSDTFQKTMFGLYGKADYGQPVSLSRFRAKLGTIASLSNRFANACNKKSTDNGDSELSEEHSDYEMPNKRTVENAERGWRILRRHVNDLVAKKKGSAASMNWAMLQQTMKGMSDLEKARIDLYKRYGIIPTVRSDGSVVQENTMLSERARNQAQLMSAAKGDASIVVLPVRRAQSHRPPSWSQRNTYNNITHKVSYKYRRPKSSLKP